MLVDPHAARNAAVRHRVPKSIEEDSHYVAVVVGLGQIALGPVRNLGPPNAPDVASMKSCEVLQHGAACGEGRKVGMGHSGSSPGRPWSKADPDVFRKACKPVQEEPPCKGGPVA